MGGERENQSLVGNCQFSCNSMDSGLGLVELKELRILRLHSPRALVRALHSSRAFTIVRGFYQTKQRSLKPQMVVTTTCIVHLSR